VEQALADETELVRGLVQLLCVRRDAEGAGAGVLVLPIAPTEETDAQHPRSAGDEAVPDRVPDDVALLWGHSELLGAGEEEVNLRLGALDAASFVDDRLRPGAERLERRVDSPGSSFFSSSFELDEEKVTKMHEERRADKAIRIMVQHAAERPGEFNHVGWSHVG
jgi:hypothetical protein